MDKILVIEDEKAVRTSIRDLLVEKRFDVYLAEGGKEGLNLAKKVNPDLIICDIMMSDMDGYMVIEYLKKSVATADIPFLFLTAKADPTDLRKGMGLGADDYLFKPFKAKDLLQAINIRLSKKQESENKFKQIWDQSRDGMCLVDDEEKICIANNAFTKVISRPLNSFLNHKFNSNFNSKKINFNEITQPLEIIEEIELWNCEVKYLSLSVSPFNSSDSHNSFLCILRDITAQKTNELEIIKSLKEKEVLLKEIHHRVKNNLQIISSLLSLQSNYIDDTKAKDMFLKSQNRIRSMSLIHEKLYQSHNLSEIDFSDYVHELSNYLAISYNISSNQINFAFDVDEIVCHIDVAIPLGIILNELITNSFKHAFNKIEKGEINIIIKKEENRLILRYKDNGSGLPSDFDPQNIITLGFSLITNLTEQLNASLTIFKGEHFDIKISAPLNE